MTQLDASSTALSTSTPLEAPDTRQQQQQRPTTAAAIAELPSPSTLPPVSATYSPIVLPPLYLDPETYLLDERFHRSLRWRPSWFAEDDEDDDGAAMERHRVTYAVCGSLDDEAPVLVWLNGLGGHRLAGVFLDGLAREMRIRLITVDRPGAGGTTRIPLARRAEASHEALLAILAQEEITTFSLLSHSNGVLYALYTLLHLPPQMTVTGWHLSSPYVPPWHSGSKSLSIARWIPTSAIALSLGTVLPALMRAEGAVSSWSAGGWSWSGGMSSALASASAGAGLWSGGVAQTLMGNGAPPPPPSPSPPPPPPQIQSSQEQDHDADVDDEPTRARARLDRLERQYVNFARRQAHKPVDKVAFGGRYHGSEAIDLVYSWMQAEGIDALGDEALVCLYKWRDGVRWGWEGEGEGEGNGDGEAREGEGVAAADDDDDGMRDTQAQTQASDETRLFERGFASLKKKLQDDGRTTDMHVVYGSDDFLIPTKGQEFLRELLVDKLGLVKASGWKVVPGCGHDETIGLECVAVPLFRAVALAAEEEDRRRKRAKAP